VLLSNDVDSAFEDMSPAMQAVNRSYFLEDAKAKEIAEDRGVSEATVREQIRKGRKHLRESLAVWTSRQPTRS
jgi:RNA polymerase sigma factor (sigma-70 family)